MVYTPISIFFIGMACGSAGNCLIGVITYLAVPFFFFATQIDEIGINVIDFPGVLIPAVLFTLVGAGIGAGIHRLKKSVKKTS